MSRSHLEPRVVKRQKGSFPRVAPPRQLEPAPFHRIPKPHCSADLSVPWARLVVSPATL